MQSIPNHPPGWRATILLLMALWAGQGLAESPAGPMLPDGVKIVWDLGKAYREKTKTARAHLPERPVALAAGQGGRCRRARRRVGLLQGPRVLAGKRQLHPGRYPDALLPSGLEERGSARARQPPGISAKSPSRESGPAAASPCAPST